MKRPVSRTPMGDKRFYVYELLYPDGFISDDGVDLSNVIFYIGKGKVSPSSVIQRVDWHEFETPYPPHGDGSLNNKLGAITAIWRKGMQVKKRIVFECDSQREALTFEMGRIVENVTPYLTNVRKTRIRPFDERVVQPSPAQQEIKEPKRVWSYVTTNINPGFIVDGKIHYRPTNTQGFVPVMIKCKVRHPDGSLCAFHVGEEATILPH